MPVLATAIRQLRDYKYGRKSLVSQKMEFSRQRGPKTSLWIVWRWHWTQLCGVHTVSTLDTSVSMLFVIVVYECIDDESTFVDDICQ